MEGVDDFVGVDADFAADFFDDGEVGLGLD